MGWTTNASNWYRQATSPFYDGNSPLEPRSVIDGFPLPSTNFEPAKMPMHLVHPRNDSDADARHKYAHSGMEYQLPIGVQGGAWPFTYQILSAPTGATIGNYYDDADYGVIKWNPPTSGTFSFTVRITDQQLNEITTTWFVTVDDSKFVFIQDGWTGTKTGTITEPLEDFADWYKGDRNDNTFAGRFVVFRGGNYSLVGDAVNNSGNVNYDPVNKTRTFIGFPNENPIVDCATAEFVFNSDINDFYVGGITWNNGRSDVNNPHYFYFTGQATRSTFWNNTFSNLGAGLVGNDNTAPLYYNNNGTDIRENILIKSNTFDGINNSSDGNGSLVDLYSTSYVLVEENTASNSDTNYGFWMKFTENFVSVRNNLAMTNMTGTLVVIGGSGTSGNDVHDTEVCWNRLSLATDSRDVFTWTGGGTTHFNDYLYRNTLVGKPAFLFAGTENFESTANIFVSNDFSFLNRSYVTATRDEQFSRANTPLDSNALLTGAARTTYLGLVGEEVSEV